MSFSDLLAAHGWQLALMLALLGCSAFFSGTETALFSLTRGQLYRLGHAPGRLGRLVHSLLLHPQGTLATLLLGNILVNTAYTAISAVLVLQLHAAGAPRAGLVIASVAPLLLLILVGEVAPKMLAFVLQESWARAAAAPTVLLQRVLLPLQGLLVHALVRPLTKIFSPRAAQSPHITAEELAAVLELSARRGLLDHTASELLQEIIDLTGLRVRDIMVPRVDMVAYDVDGPREGLERLFRQTRLRRIPVYERHIDRILGQVHSKRFFLSGGLPLRQLTSGVLFVPEAANLERLLVQFRVMRTHTAIVVDEYGGTAGLVSLEDVLEEIVGEIADSRAGGEAPAVVPVGTAEYLLDGGLPIHEWQEAFAIDLAGQRISTIGGFVTSRLGRIPQAGDSVTVRNLRLTVQEMRGRRIARLRAELTEDFA